jgi:hypothetical protein
VQDYLAANRVDLQEVRLGRTPAMVRAERDAAFGAYDRGEITLEQRNAILEQSEPATTRHHLGAYRKIKTEIPGGENYREILLTLPQKQAPIAMPDTSKWSVVRLKAQPEFSSADLDRLTELNRKISNDMAYGIQTPTETINEFKAISEMYDASRNPDRIKVFDEQGKLVGAMVNFDGTDEDIIQQTLRGFLQRQSQIANQQTNYHSSHFVGQPNILAHMRVNDRVVDGKKTLFIEEVQSDWHQAGRKKGYQIPKGTLPEGHTVAKELNTDNQPVWVVRDKNGEAVGFGGNKEESLNSLRPTGVPDAPFKTTWHELSLKRAIQEASEKGYDQIAFTTGKTQAERYDLSKQVSTLRAPYDNGEYVVSYIPKGANDYEYMGRFLEKDLPGAVGKELAEKIVANKNIQSMTYKGDDLVVGGEGMKGFYDQILPKSLEKLGKKFDAKVGKTDMDGVEVWKMDITPKMRESVLTKGQPLFAATPAGLGLLGSEEE